MLNNKIKKQILNLKLTKAKKIIIKEGNNKHQI